MKRLFDINPISEISTERCNAFKNLVDKLNAKKCPWFVPQPIRRYSPPVNKTPIENVVGVFGKFRDQDNVYKDGIKFICPAKQKSILYYDKNTPVFGKTFYGKFEKIKFTLGDNNDFFMTPAKVNLMVGDVIFKTNENGSYIYGEVNHPTEFWIYTEEENEILFDNKGEIEFVLFFYSELSSDQILGEIAKL
jgi:hypothetical protein